jgi:hypothetical protein
MLLALKKFFLALGLWIADVIRSGGRPPYNATDRLTGFSPRYSLRRAIESVPSDANTLYIFRDALSCFKVELWKVKLSNKRRRYPLAVRRRLGQ